MRALFLLTVFLFSLAVLSPRARAQEAAPDFDKAVAAAQAGDIAKGIAIASGILDKDAKDVRARLLRGRLYTRQGEHDKALSDFTEVTKVNEKNAEAWQRRGEADFRLSRFKESVADFDCYLKLVPDEKPYHWQRGISLYYAGRFADGKKQFELHQTVNSNDVENAVWHFLCAARAEGVEAARKQLIPIEGDARIPMAEVHRLFSGKGTVEQVQQSADAAPKNQQTSAQFYADLYLGLYYEALNDKPKTRAHILKAAERAKENGYMGDVARVHAERIKKG
jgi:lipoprotein NlpI